MAHSNKNNDEPTLGFTLTIAFFLGLWLLFGLGVQGILQIFIPDSEQPAYFQKDQ